MDIKPLRKTHRDHLKTYSLFNNTMRSNNFRATFKSSFASPDINLIDSNDGNISFKDLNISNPNVFDKTNPDHIDALIDMILCNTEYKEFLSDLVINEEFVNYKLERNEHSEQQSNPIKNMCMKSDWSEDEDIESDHINFIKQKQKPNTRGSSRRFGQHLHPIFFQNQRAHTNVIK